LQTGVLLILENFDDALLSLVLPIVLWKVSREKQLLLYYLSRFEEINLESFNASLKLSIQQLWFQDQAI